MAAKKEVLPTDVKKGERLLVISSKNHGASINGSILTVITERINGNNYLLLSGEHGQRYNLYYSKPADSFRRVTRIEEAEYVEAGIIDLEAQIKEKKKEVQWLSQQTGKKVAKPLASDEITNLTYVDV